LRKHLNGKAENRIEVGKIKHNNMNILKITNGKLELRKSSGSLIRIIQSSSVINADINKDGTLIVITNDKGQVILRKESGSLIRTICTSNCINAKFSSNDIIVLPSLIGKWS